MFNLTSLSTYLPTAVVLLSLEAKYSKLIYFTSIVKSQGHILGTSLYIPNRHIRDRFRSAVETLGTVLRPENVVLVRLFLAILTLKRHL